MIKQPAHLPQTRRRARCEFIPPFVIDHLARDDREEVRAAVLATAHQAMASRTSRTEQKVTIDQVAAAAGLMDISAAPSQTGEAARKVYDCHKQWTKRVELVRREGADPTGDADADSAYDLVGVTRDFLKKELGRNSIDNLGMDLILNVHLGVKYMNAAWDGQEMVFGLYATKRGWRLLIRGVGGVCQSTPQ
jgi:Zn-dependent metalloprotease